LKIDGNVGVKNCVKTGGETGAQIEVRIEIGASSEKKRKTRNIAFWSRTLFRRYKFHVRRA
jgi:hypothetical protein